MERRGGNGERDGKVPKVFVKENTVRTCTENRNQSPFTIFIHSQNNVGPLKGAWDSKGEERYACQTASNAFVFFYSISQRNRGTKWTHSRGGGEAITFFLEKCQLRSNQSHDKESRPCQLLVLDGRARGRGGAFGGFIVIIILSRLGRSFLWARFHRAEEDCHIDIGRWRDRSSSANRDGIMVDAKKGEILCSGFLDTTLDFWVSEA